MHSALLKNVPQGSKRFASKSGWIECNTFSCNGYCTLRSMLAQGLRTKHCSFLTIIVTICLLKLLILQKKTI